jgi:4-amino-4-deoxy-L-arabinose transferase-like glycosyltransferase
LRIDLMRPLPWVLIGLALSMSLAVRLDYSPDSMHYVDIARNLASGQGLTSFHLNVFSQSVPDAALFWPPAYPVLLAAFMKLGLAPLLAVRAVFVLAFTATAVLMYLIGKRLATRTGGIICLMIWLGVAPHLNIWAYAWSEPLFIALSAAFVLVLARAVRRSFQPAGFLAAGALAGLATMCRYTGVTALVAGLVATACLIYVKRPRRAGLVLVTSLVLVLLGFALVASPWFLHNRSITGNFMGVARPPAITSLPESIARMARSLGSDLMLPLGVAAILIALGGSSRASFGGTLKNMIAPADNPIAFISVVWTVVYLGTLLVVASTYEFDPIDTRLTSPVYIVLIPLLIAIGYAVYAGGSAVSERLSGAALAVVFGLLVASVVVNCGARLQLLKRDRAEVPAVAEWIEDRTPHNSLVVGLDAWWIRFRTGRPVLESGDMIDLSPGKVSAFLRKFGRDFPAIYVLASGTTAEKSELKRGYASHGYSLEERHTEGDDTVYQVVRPPVTP